MLTPKQIGIINFGLSILLAVIIITSYFTIQDLVRKEGGECKLGNECPVHEAFPIQTIIGLIVVSTLAVTGLMLIVQPEGKQSIKLPQAREKRKSEFEVILSALNTDEQTVLKVIKAQPGIPQNTLRLKTDFSKAKLSTMLKGLENRGLIAKEPDGKTYRIYLKKA